MNNFQDLLNKSIDTVSVKIYKNPDTEIYEQMTAAVKENNGYCPCEVQATADTKCPCLNFRKAKSNNIAEVCHCGRYCTLPAAAVVCLCGSTRFYEVFQQVAAALTNQGFIVLAPYCYHHYDQTIFTDTEKQKLDNLHKAKIAKADYILIINKDGYIGESTQSEIDFAEALNKPIYYLEDNE